MYGSLVVWRKPILGVVQRNVHPAEGKHGSVPILEWSGGRFGVPAPGSDDGWLTFDLLFDARLSAAREPISAARLDAAWRWIREPQMIGHKWCISMRLVAETEDELLDAPDDDFPIDELCQQLGLLQTKGWELVHVSEDRAVRDDTSVVYRARYLLKSASPVG